ncbi:hypothetical protein Hanom_Chr00s000004g01610501 [Helianthus anomalus]
MSLKLWVIMVREQHIESFYDILRESTLASDNDIPMVVCSDFRQIDGSKGGFEPLVFNSPTTLPSGCEVIQSRRTILGPIGK